MARFPGGSHANGNFAPCGRVAPPLAAELDALFAAIGRARPDIDLFRLERMSPELDGLANPLIALPHHPHPNVGLAVNLDGGFDGVMSRASGKRKRKKHRAQARKFEALGPISVKRAEGPEEIAGLLDIFFTIKGDRLKRLGVADVFADPKIRAFFKRLFADARGGEFVVDHLAVAGKTRAITGSSHCGDRLICEFSAIADDDLTRASPGDYLFFENIAAACGTGKSVYDFSVGDETYKRMWCDIETTYVDIHYPLGLMGALLAGFFSLRSTLVRRLKSNRKLWSSLKRMRRRDSEPATTDED
ncbi:MAG: GNAT family N-acetyltransferase [Phyllobacteriaceae bacterium]|nr:GNAT family N-acetyltransferase [Phyllobacteriaceae bacterium]